MNNRIEFNRDRIAMATIPPDELFDQEDADFFKAMSAVRGTYQPPWETPPLHQWTLVGMCHHWHQGGGGKRVRGLFASVMGPEGDPITEAGAQGAELWKTLCLRAEQITAQHSARTSRVAGERQQEIAREQSSHPLLAHLRRELGARRQDPSKKK